MNIVSRWHDRFVLFYCLCHDYFTSFSFLRVSRGCGGRRGTSSSCPVLPGNTLERGCPMALLIPKYLLASSAISRWGRWWRQRYRNWGGVECPVQLLIFLSSFCKQSVMAESRTFLQRSSARGIHCCRADMSLVVTKWVDDKPHSSNATAALFLLLISVLQKFIVIIFYLQVFSLLFLV